MSIRTEYEGCQRRVCREGWTGRRRHYTCRMCRQDFIHDSAYPLPEKSRICYVCRLTPTGMALYDQGFVEHHESEEAQGLIP